MSARKHFAGLLLITGMFLATIKGYSQDPNFHIYLCFGQSNMEGQGAIEFQDRNVDERFKVMAAVDYPAPARTKGEWYTAVPPLTRSNNGLSPADYFGRTMVANLPDSITVGIINVSIAGCKIELFDKDDYQDYVATINPVSEAWLINIINIYDGNPYQYLVDLAKLAQQDGVIKGFLLHQGESNTGDSQWPDKVKGVYDSLIADLGLDPGSIPLLAGEVVNADQGGICASMNPIIATLPATLPNSYVISSAGVSDAPDNLHFNAAGYRELGRRYAVKMLSLMDVDIIFGRGSQADYLEAECGTVGENWKVVEDAGTSNNAYVTVEDGMGSTETAPSDSAATLYYPFTLGSGGIFAVNALVRCPTADDNSFWVKIDDGEFVNAGTVITNVWMWVQLFQAELADGEHTLAIAFAEDGARLDKLCISDFMYLPSAKGNEAVNICEPSFPPTDIRSGEVINGYSLGQNFPNPFSGNTAISFEIPEASFVSLKVFNSLGTEIAELGGKIYHSGKHVVEFGSSEMTAGNYLYILKTDHYIARRRMIYLDR